MAKIWVTAVTGECYEGISPYYTRGFHVWLDKPDEYKPLQFCDTLHVYVKVKGEGLIVKGIEERGRLGKRRIIVCRRIKTR